jgi:hypothetical protein
MRFPLLLSLLFCTLYSFAQTPVQVIKGRVQEMESHQGMAEATVVVISLDPIVGVVTDSLGNFRLENIPVGRHIVEIRNLGYQTQRVTEVLVEAGKETVLNTYMIMAEEDLEMITVRATKPVQIHPLSTRLITIEQTLRFPATFFDPARAAGFYPGVVNQNDQANALSIRGNSPAGLVWMLEGIEVANPNHTPNAGTFSDRIMLNAGGVNILSALMLDHSTLITGAFPAGFGNARSGVMDMAFREGNSEVHEQTVQLGLIGLEAAVEGPINANNGSSYLANYRYSTVGLLTGLGVDFGDEEINYQDGAFKLSFPGKDGGKWTVLGVGGWSSNLFEGAQDSTLWEVEKDRMNINFTSNTLIFGGGHERKYIGSRLHWKTDLIYSRMQSTREGVRILDDLSFRLQESDEYQEQKLGLRSEIKKKLSSNGFLRAGVRVSWQQYFLDALFSNVYFTNTSQDLLDVQFLQFQPFLEYRQMLGKRWNLKVGLHSLGVAGDNFLFSPEPRASLAFLTRRNGQFALAYGLHSQLPAPQLLAKNPDLDLLKSHHIGLRFHQQIRNDQRVSVELFYQSLFDVPVTLASSSFSGLNVVEVYNPFIDLLVSDGTGNNRGIELEWQRYMVDEWFAMVNATLFRSEYTGSDGVKRSTLFDGQYAANVAGGREFSWQRKGKSRILGVHLRGVYYGGWRQSPVDESASLESGVVVFDDEQAYSETLPDYFRMDLRIYLKRNTQGRNAMLALDLQNLINRRNVAFRYFDFQQQQTVDRLQLGLIPILSWRLDF